MLYYDRIDVSEGININKTSTSKECDIFRYWYFFDTGFIIQPYACNDYHDVLTKSMNLSNIAIIKNHGVDYGCVITGISKSEAVNLDKKLI